MKDLTTYIQEALKITKDSKIDDKKNSVYMIVEDPDEKKKFLTTNIDEIKRLKNHIFGVAVITDKCEFAISSTMTRGVSKFGLESRPNYNNINATKVDSFVKAMKDFNGEKNCEGWMKATDEKMSVINKVNKFSKGKEWLPSVGELVAIYTNLEEINRLLNLMPYAYQITTGEFWASTLYTNSDKFWTVNIISGMVTTNSKLSTCNYIGICHIEDLMK